MKEQFKQLFLIHTALLAGLILFCGVVIFLNKGQDVVSATMPFNLVIPLLLIGTTFAAYFINEQKKKEKVEGGLQQKIDHYRKTVVIRSALLEVSGLFTTVVYMLENAWIYLVYFAIAWLLLRFFRPSLDQFKKQYELTEEEKQMLL